MLAFELISEVVPVIHPNDTAAEALGWMDVFRVSHLPVVDNKTYFGLISDSDIFDLNKPESRISEYPHPLSRPYVKDQQHIYEVIDAVSKYKITVVPVLNQQEEYLGLITVNDLAQKFSLLMSAENPGGIIVLEIKSMDYSLSEISQIVEGNDAKILSLYVRTYQMIDQYEITLKLNRTDLSAVIQTFERYNYQIKAIYANSSEVDSLMKDRLDSFFKYLNV